MDDPEYKLCKRGHVRSPENVTSSGACKECKKAANRNRNKTDEVREYYRNRLRGNPEHHARQKRWRDANKDRSAQMIRDWTQSNQDKNKRYCRDRYERLTDCVVANSLHISVADASPELIAIKRNQMLFKRELKKMREAVSG